MMAIKIKNWLLSLRKNYLCVSITLASAILMGSMSTEGSSGPEGKLPEPESPISSDTHLTKNSYNEDLKQYHDPFEGFNRVMFETNYFLDGVALTPLAQVYKTLTPHLLRKGVSNVLDNLLDPINSVNSLLQGKPELAAQGVARFLINSILGVFGLFDLAEACGLPQHKEDFGQTLAVWGVDPGPYLVLPIIGPISTRDFIGRAVDAFADPTNITLSRNNQSKYVYFRYGLYIISKRSQAIEAFDTIYETSIDPYATFRSLYQQHRLNEIMDGAPESFAGGPEAYINDNEEF